MNLSLSGDNLLDVKNTTYVTCTVQYMEKGTQAFHGYRGPQMHMHEDGCGN